jgi:16S rRNA processing protein RimM
MTEAPDAVFAAGARVFTGSPKGDADGGALTVEYTRPIRDGLLTAFREIPDRTAAERWRDRHLLVPEREVTPPASDEVFVHDLIGLSLQTPDAGPIGVVTGMYDVAGRLLLEVTRAGAAQTVLIPYETTFVRRVDLEARVLTMDLPEGLLD